MRVGLSDRQRQLRARARALADELTAYELRCERENGLPADVIERLKDKIRAAGMNATNMPVEHGGQGLSVLEQVIVEEQLGRLTNSLWALAWRPANALLACDPQQRDRYLIPAIEGRRRGAFAITEADAGSDPRAISTVAVAAGDRLRLRGEKWFVTSGDVADFLIVLARLEGEDQFCLFLVDKDLPGVTVKDIPLFTHTYVFEHPTFALDVELDRSAMLGQPGEGYELTRSWFVEERLMIAARCVGAATRALEESNAHAHERVQFGRPISDNQMIQQMLADSAVDIALNRSLLYDVAREVDDGADRKLVHAKAAMVKLAASEAAGRVLDRAVQIFGGRGYMRAFAVERLSREVRVDRIWEGTSEIQRLIIANHLGKRGLDGLLAAPWS
ncbi:MAG TPA: acyl-CoA dehydrogenase family protein [Solirubrobacteraceae bacterium]|nr:acyl-CoA dehydrogenase family protein [Solirubrobacteraceae bacterium]